MSETTTQVRPDDFGRPFGREGEVLPPSGGGDPGIPDLASRRPPHGGAVDQALAQIVVAQQTPVKRDIARILKDINDSAKIAYTDWYYEWQTKNRDGSSGTVRGPSIKCAMALAHIWGNCRVEAFPTTETQTHWVFLARFTDYEKGVTVTRAFQQRKAQTSGGKMDAERMMDIAFQIGQSKAIRNVIVGALGMFVDRAVEAARESMFSRVDKNRDGAKARIFAMAKSLGMTGPQRLNRAVGRSEKDWTVDDMVLLLSKLHSVDDGMESMDEAFPEPDAENPPPKAAGQSAVPPDKAGRGSGAPTRRAAQSNQQPPDTEGGETDQGTPSTATADIGGVEQKQADVKPPPPTVRDNAGGGLEF
jgi:hypothetical protein